MKTKLRIFFLLFTCAFFLLPCKAQVPQGFNYQAIARDGSGNVIPNHALPTLIDIVDAQTGGNLIYEESFPSITSNQFGLISLIVGTGTRTGGSAASFSVIDWKSKPLYIRTIIEYPGTTWTTMGTSQIMSVPYSLLAKDVQGPVTNVTSLGIIGTTDVMDSALFAVRNKAGNLVFAVYNEGVRAYVGNGSKGTKGGFAVGGYDGTKSGSQHDLLYVTSDSVRVYVDTHPSTKGIKGGFSVGGYDMTKGGTAVQDLLDISKDSARVYVDSNPATKGVKGGFAVGGYDMTKGGSVSNYLNIETNTTGIIDPAENRLLWYPLKNSFMTGKVLIQKNDTVGVNSFASGYESKAIGDWSQALGYTTIARGNYSTAIGKNSQTKGDNSFAFGNQAKATAADSYAFGTGAKATAQWSFALGSVGVDSLGVATGPTIASGIGAFALGFGSVSSSQGAFSFGVQDTASGLFSLGMGYLARAKGHFSTTLGLGTITEPASWVGLATGFVTKAGAWAASSFGDQTYASGFQSFATGYKTLASGQLSSTFGDETTAQSFESMTIGRFNVISGSGTTWVDSDPVFAIGIGTSTSTPRNALTVYKNGNMDLYGTLNKTNIMQESIEINAGGAGNRFSLIDFHSDETYTDFSFRILRNTGVNGSTDIIHRGTGNLNLTTVENSPIVFSTLNAESMRIKGSNGYVGINTASPVYRLDVAGSININKGYSGSALYTNGAQAIWYDGTYYSWGYGGTYNVFNSPMTIGGTYYPGGYFLNVNGNAWSYGSWGSSDIRWKKNIKDLEIAVDNICKLNGVSFEWRKDEFPENNFDSDKHIGLIAQDVEKIFPELVKTDNNGFKAISYDKLTVILLEGMKDQQKQIKSQQEQIDRLEKLVGEINAKLDAEAINK
ncbi:MAG: tail fiber domain-containing protein [Bacteroidales bacterium]